MAASKQKTQISPATAQIAEPMPGECLACFIHRGINNGCSGKTLMRRYGASLLSVKVSLVPWLASLGAGCDCEVVTVAFEPCVYQICTDDGTPIRPRALVEVHACFGVERNFANPCGLWARARPHPGPPWT